MPLPEPEPVVEPEPEPEPGVEPVLLPLGELPVDMLPVPEPDGPCALLRQRVFSASLVSAEQS